MKTPLQRIRRGGCVLVAVVVVAVLGYRYLGGYDWIDSIWMVVITISTVGYSEQSSLSPGLQLFTILVILFGMTAAVYTFGGLVQMMLEGELEHAIGRRRMTREVDQLRNHVIICGYGRMGQNLAAELRNQSVPVIVIDNDPQTVEDAISQDMLCVQGDATEEQLLESVRISQARTLVAALPRDAENVFITLTSRNLNPNIQIVARAEHRSTEKKLRQAGADKVVMPTIVGAQQMVRMITRPITADLMELVAEAKFTELELDEISVPKTSKLIGMTLGESAAHREYKLLMVAIKRPDGELLFNPPADQTFQSDDIIMLMGQTGEIRRYRQKFGL